MPGYLHPVEPVERLLLAPGAALALPGVDERPKLLLAGGAAGLLHEAHLGKISGFGKVEEENPAQIPNSITMYYLFEMVEPFLDL